VMTRTKQLLYFAFSDQSARARRVPGMEAMSPLLRGIQQHLTISTVRASDVHDV